MDGCVRMREWDVLGWYNDGFMLFTRTCHHGHFDHRDLDHRDLDHRDLDHHDHHDHCDHHDL